MKKQIAIFIIVMSMYLSPPVLAVAQESPLENGLVLFSENTLLPNEDFEVVVARLINAALTLAGLFLVFIFLYGGAVWMLALGDETKVEKAKNTMIQGVIGLVIIMASYSIADYLIDALNSATGS